MGLVERRPKVLVTGGSGFLGSAVAKLLQDDFRVVIYDLVAPDPSLALFDYVYGDILDPDRLADAMAGCEAVFHFAARLGVEYCQDDEDGVIAVNGAGTRQVVGLVTESASVRQVLAMSSSEVYGEGGNRILREDDTLGPRSTYARTKVLLEAEMASLARQGSHIVTVIRPFNVYGPRQRDDFVVPRFCIAALKSDPIPVFGTGKQTRTFTYIDDAASGIVGAFSYQRSKAEPYSLYNIASRETVSIRTIANLIRRMARSDSEVILVPFQDGSRKPREEVDHRVASIDRANSSFGFEPLMSLAEGIRSTLYWYQHLNRVVGSMSSQEAIEFQAS